CLIVGQVIRAARDFLNPQPHHASVRAGLLWWSREFERAKRGTQISDRHHALYEEAVLFAYRSGVTPEEFLCRTIAGSLADLTDDSFIDDTYSSLGPQLKMTSLSAVNRCCTPKLYRF